MLIGKVFYKTILKIFPGLMIDGKLYNKISRTFECTDVSKFPSNRWRKSCFHHWEICLKLMTDKFTIWTDLDSVVWQMVYYRLIKKQMSRVIFIQSVENIFLTNELRHCFNRPLASISAVLCFQLDRDIFRSRKYGKKLPLPWPVAEKIDIQNWAKVWEHMIYD